MKRQTFGMLKKIPLYKKLCKIVTEVAHGDVLNFCYVSVILPLFVTCLKISRSATMQITCQEHTFVSLCYDFDMFVKQE